MTVFKQLTGTPTKDPVELLAAMEGVDYPLPPLDDSAKRRLAHLNGDRMRLELEARKWAAHYGSRWTEWCHVVKAQKQPVEEWVEPAKGNISV